MIAITGSTGQLGNLVVRRLAQTVPAREIVAIARNADKAKPLADLGVGVRLADYEKPETWAPALDGVDKLLLISASDVGKRARQHAVVIEAAKKAGVKLLVYTSLLHTPTSSMVLTEEHRLTEGAILASGIPSVILRNGWYIENHLMALRAALAMGSVYGCAGDGRFSAAARADYADAAVAVLTQEGHAGKAYELAGDTSYTLAEYATELSRQTGKNITYVNMPEAPFAQALVGAGLPEPLALLLANADSATAKGALLDDSKTLSRLIGRPTTPLSEVVKAAL